jgi:hypothetical protein
MKHRTLNDFLERSGLEMSKGGSRAETGVHRRARNDKLVQIQRLNRDELSAVKPDFRGWFSGNVILIPRSLNEATYHCEPVAYASTFNAVIPASQYRDSIKGTIAEKAMPYMPAKFVKGRFRDQKRLVQKGPRERRYPARELGEPSLQAIIRSDPCRAAGHRIRRSSRGLVAYQDRVRAAPSLRSRHQRRGKASGPGNRPNEGQRTRLPHRSKDRSERRRTECWRGRMDRHPIRREDCRTSPSAPRPRRVPGS